MRSVIFFRSEINLIPFYEEFHFSQVRQYHILLVMLSNIQHIKLNAGNYHPLNFIVPTIIWSTNSQGEKVKISL